MSQHSTDTTHKRRHKTHRPRPHAAAGLPGASRAVEDHLRQAGIDPDRLSILHLGLPVHLLRYPYPPWVRRLFMGYALWLLPVLFHTLGVALPSWLDAGLALVTGLVVMQVACELFVAATERLAARWQWDHYVAGTVAEILSTIPEFVAIAFVIPVSPLSAFIIALITIYNNALVFSLYSYFLPKDHEGRFLMPKPITDAGTQVLIAGAAMGLILGLVMLAFSTGEHPKRDFQPHDLLIISVILFLIFGVYLYKLVNNYAQEEATVRETLSLTEEEIEHRKALVYQHVKRSAPATIALLFVLAAFGAFLGGECVAEFAHAGIQDLGLNPVMTALILAAFAGMSEYVILWKSHRKQEYGIALANAFGGITQVMLLVFPFTLVCIAAYQGLVNPAHPDLPIPFTLTNVLLLIFLFPTFFVLAELIREDHTLGILDTTIMTVIVALLILLLVTYGANDAATHPT